MVWVHPCRSFWFASSLKSSGVFSPWIFSSLWSVVPLLAGCWQEWSLLSQFGGAEWEKILPRLSTDGLRRFLSAGQAYVSIWKTNVVNLIMLHPSLPTKCVGIACTTRWRDKRLTLIRCLGVPLIASLTTSHAWCVCVCWAWAWHNSLLQNPWCWLKEKKQRGQTFLHPFLFMFQKWSLQNDESEILLWSAFHRFMVPEICFDHFVVLALGLNHSFCRGGGFDWSDCSYKYLFQLLHVNWKGDLFTS